MTYDKEGFDLIKKGLQQDKARLRLRIKQEVKQEFEKKNVRYLGSLQQQEAAMKAERIKLSNEIKRRIEMGEAQLDDMAWGGFGEGHFERAYKREQKIEAAQQRFKDHQNGLPRYIDKQQDPGSLTYAQNRAAEKGARPEKEQLTGQSQSREEKSQSEDHHNSI